MAATRKSVPAGKPTLKMKKMRDPDLLRSAVRFSRLAKLKKRAEERRAELQALLLDQLSRRKADRVKLGDVEIVRKQNAASKSIDSEELLKELTPKQRKAVLVDQVDLNRLSAELRARLEAVLSSEERSSITRTVLDEAALKAQVAAGRIPQELVDRHTRTHQSAPYVQVFGA